MPGAREAAFKARFEPRGSAPRRSMMGFLRGLGPQTRPGPGLAWLVARGAPLGIRVLQEVLQGLLEAWRPPGTARIAREDQPAKAGWSLALSYPTDPVRSASVTGRGSERSPSRDP